MFRAADLITTKLHTVRESDAVWFSLLYYINVVAYAAKLQCFYRLAEPKDEQKISCKTVGLRWRSHQNKNAVAASGSSFNRSEREVLPTYSHDKKATGHQVLILKSVVHKSEMEQLLADVYTQQRDGFDISGSNNNTFV